MSGDAEIRRTESRKPVRPRRVGAGVRFGLAVLGHAGHAWVASLLLLAVVLAVVAVQSVAPGAGLVSVPFGLLVVLGVLFAAAALRVRVEPALGIRLPRNLSPTVHDVIDSLRAKLGAPPFADILLGTRMEMRTIRVPRLGGLRGYHEYLLIGLPLMLALPLEHLRALIAHEMVHRSRSRGTRGTRVYRLRDGLLQTAHWTTSSRHLAVRPLKPFFQWFAPRFARLAFDAARDHELAADRRAALMTSRNDLAGALLRLHVIERFLVERFYPRVLADLRQYGVAPTGLRGRFESALDGMRDDPRFHSWIDDVIHRDATPEDTHPPLRIRLGALALGNLWTEKHREVIDAAFGEELAGMSSARLSLAALPESVVVTIEKAWIDEMESSLSQRHAELVRMDARRRELEARSDLSATEMLDHAIATAETEGIDAALPTLQRLAGLHPDMAPARFVLGTLLLRKNDPDGLAHIHAAARLDPELDAPARELAAGFLRAHERQPAESDRLDSVLSARQRTANHGAMDAAVRS